MRIAYFSSICALGLCIAGCGGAMRIDAPEITSVTMGTTSVTVYWELDTDIEDISDFAGYNVYVSTDSNELLVEDGEDLNKYNANVITDTVFEIRGLPTAQLYYVQVRTLNTEDKVGSYNENVPFVSASPRPEFTVVLKLEVNTPGVDDSCAVRFHDALVMPDSAMADSGAGMWVDGISSHFSSPHNHPEFGAQAQTTYFANLGQLELNDVTEITTEPSDASVDFSTGDLIIAKTQDNNYVKIHVDGSDGTYVTITYAYQDVADFPKLTP